MDGGEGDRRRGRAGREHLDHEDRRVSPRATVLSAERLAELEERVHVLHPPARRPARLDVDCRIESDPQRIALRPRAARAHHDIVDEAQLHDPRHVATGRPVRRVGPQVCVAKGAAQQHGPKLRREPLELAREQRAAFVIEIAERAVAVGVDAVLAQPHARSPDAREALAGVHERDDEHGRVDPLARVVVPERRREAEDVVHKRAVAAQRTGGVIGHAIKVDGQSVAHRRDRIAIIRVGGDKRGDRGDGRRNRLGGRLREARRRRA